MRDDDDPRVSAFLDELAQPTLSRRVYSALAKNHRRLTLDPSFPAFRSPLARPKPLREVLRHARRLAIDRPSDAAVIGELAVMIARRARIRAKRTSEWLRLEADACRELADILLRCSHLRRARHAALRAKALYRRPHLAPTRDECRVDLTHGQIVFQQGDRETGLAIIEDAGERLRRDWGDPVACAKAKSIYGTLLLRIDAYERAMPYFRESLIAGGERLDEYAIASNLLDTAICALKLGKLVGWENLAAAQAKFEQLGASDAVWHCEALRVEILHDEGKVSEAISELYKLRDKALQEGLPKVAAQLTVNIMEWLVEQQRSSEAMHAARGQRRQLVDGGLLPELAKFDKLLAECGAAGE
jgi:tetratricopeptide (TPR) repeat protein